MSAVLSFDFGTGGVRAGVFDVETLTQLGTAEARYETRYPRPGWAEQDPRQWLDAMERAGREAVLAGGRDDVVGVCVATTSSTVVLCSAAGAPLRPAILWMDCRAQTQSAATAELDHPVMAYCGGSDAVEWLVPKAMWTAQNEPDTYAEADLIVEALDFVNFHLTGEWVGSRMNAACKWNYDSARACFVPSVYRQLGVPDLIGKLPSRIVPVGAAIAPMSPSMARKLGIRGTPLVAQGGIDAHIGMLGAGTVEEGEMLLIGGTSAALLVQLGEPMPMPGFWGPYPNALVDDLWLVEAGQVSAGSILDWLSREMFGLDGEGHAALIAEIRRRATASDGLLTLDYWMGNRTPYRDGELRGAIMGLSLGHTRADVYASAVDGIVLGTANVIGSLEQLGVRLERVVLAGGICNNALWLQSTVDAIGRPVHVVESDNLSLLGAGVSARCAVDPSVPLREAAKQVRAPSRMVEPVAERTAWYAERLPAYRAATDALVPTLHRLSAAQRGREGAA